MTEPWLLFRILSEPLCSCSSRTLSSLCSHRRRPFSCSARSSCSCSFWKGKRIPKPQTWWARVIIWSDHAGDPDSGVLVPTFIWSCARLRRLRVVFLIESDDSGICSLSCSRQCLNWARLQGKTSHNSDHNSLFLTYMIPSLANILAQDKHICCLSVKFDKKTTSNYLFFSSSLWTDLQTQKTDDVWHTIQTGTSHKVFNMKLYQTHLSNICSQNLLSVICSMCSPVPTCRRLLVFVLASLVRVIWTERQDRGVAMFGLCAGEKNTLDLS